MEDHKVGCGAAATTVLMTIRDFLPHGCVQNYERGDDAVIKIEREKWNCETAVCPAEGGTPNYARLTKRIFIGCKTPFCFELMPCIVHRRLRRRNRK
jgi:hypothetical protein